ncbi:hypothetical protein P4534_23180 [Peribacillus butanolivorans]|uniref:hypothetical protein n=1 Tax=Peribacillus butanolivorans TaxID=421767 RepID=UPI002E1C9B42|nr:hypothetical protein [Peribacillus butanolivorans]
MGFHSQPWIVQLTVEADTRKATLPLHSMLILVFLGGVSLQKQLATLSFNEDAASYEDFLQAIKDTVFTIETSNQ